MLKSLKSNSYRFVVVLLLLITFLTTGMVGKVVSSYALAQEITPELDPVYDTEVVSLKDYVDNVLTDAQIAVFNTILGSYVASQAGLNEYDLEYPYTNRTGVIGWLQDAGKKLYNAIITGGSFDLVTGTDLRTYIITAASYAIGMAQKAHTYTDIGDFLDDIDTSDHYFIPYDPVLQASINSYFGRSYGLWNWQFDTGSFVTTDTTKYLSSSLTSVQQNNQNSVTSNLRRPLVRYTYNVARYNGLVSDSYFSNYNILFVNTTNNTFSIVNSSGQTISSYPYSRYAYFNYYSNGTLDNTCSLTDVSLSFAGMRGSGFISQNYTRYIDLVRDIFNNSANASSDFDNIKFIAYSDWIEHVYVGANWATKQEIFNITDLNFQQNDSPSYNQVPDNSYIDLKGFLTDIVNNTNILNVILNNLFKPDGTLNVDPAFIKVSITIPDTNPLPVNLNDIQIYTENEYLDVVKQRSLQASETIGEYVAFWHNCDAELVYAILGSFIVILIGAFIGKWGHS